MFGLFSDLPLEGRVHANKIMGEILGIIEEVGGSFSYVTDGEDPHISISCEGRSYRIGNSRVIDNQFSSEGNFEIELRVRSLELLAVPRG